jgi:hypothetical protein
VEKYVHREMDPIEGTLVEPKRSQRLKDTLTRAAEILSKEDLLERIYEASFGE